MSPAARRLTALALVVLASICAFLAVLALWANRQVLNTDNWTSTSSQLLEKPRIRRQLSEFLVDRLYANVDVAAEIRDALQRPRVQVLWADANRAAQRRMLNVLEGGGSVVSTQNGTVTLDLHELLRQLEQRVGVGGRIASALPADAAQITVMRSDQLSVAQRVLKLVRGTPAVLVGVSLVLFGLALLIAPRRRRESVRGYGLGLMAAGVGGLLLRSLGGNAIIDALTQTASVKPAVHDAWLVGTTLLAQAAGAAIFYGAAMIVGAWLAGPTRPAVGLRRVVAPYARQPALAFGTLAAIVAAILLWAPTPALRNPVTAVVLVLLLALGFEVLRRQIMREHPDAATGAPTAWLRARLHGSPAEVAHVVPAQPVPSPADSDASLEQLERLGRLHDTGVLDDEEFRTQKRGILEERRAVAGNGGESRTAS